MRCEGGVCIVCEWLELNELLGNIWITPHDHMPGNDRMIEQQQWSIRSMRELRRNVVYFARWIGVLGITLARRTWDCATRGGGGRDAVMKMIGLKMINASAQDHSPVQDVARQWFGSVRATWSWCAHASCTLGVVSEWRRRAYGFGRSFRRFRLGSRVSDSRGRRLHPRT